MENKYPIQGFCLVSKQVLKDGFRVGYMQREEPLETKEDSGWRFFSGLETQEYVDDENNIILRNIEFVIDLDPSILPYMKLPYGIELERLEGEDQFFKIES